MQPTEAELLSQGYRKTEEGINSPTRLLVKYNAIYNLLITTKKPISTVQFYQNTTFVIETLMDILRKNLPDAQMEHSKSDNGFIVIVQNMAWTTNPKRTISIEFL